MKYSGIGGQAVMEGVMMQNKDTYAVAVRKPDHEIDVKVSKRKNCLLYTSPSPRDGLLSRMPSSA